MFENLSSDDRILAIQRLTALWALNECGLGGVLHALQSPFTGLLVGSIAMICIALICAFADNKWRAIMSSLAIVLIIKALVSPHTTPTAYIAVIFQGVTGAFIYKYIPGLLFSSLIFVTLGLLESAIQRLLTLTILYGNTIWNAIDIWGEFINKQWGVILPFSSSQLIIYSYLAIHLIAGLFIGWFIYRTIGSVHRNWGDSKFQLNLGRGNKKAFPATKQKGKKKLKRYILFLVLILLIIFAYTINDQASDIEKGLISILRAVVILTIWFVFLAPIFLKLLKKWLDRKHKQLSNQVAHTMDMIPHLAWIIDKAWRETKHLTFFLRWKSFILHSLLYSLQFKLTDDPDSDRSVTKS